MAKDSKEYEKYFIKPSMKDSKKRTKNDVDIVYSVDNDDITISRLGAHKSFFIRTYGCQMNEHDTEVMEGLLTSIGFNKADDINNADVIIFNTCAIRENAENKVFGEIGRLKGLKQEDPDKIFAICGCMSQEEGVVERLLQTYTWIDLIFGTHNIHRLPELLKNALLDKERVVEVWSGEGDVIENLPKHRASKTKAWVNIIYGCDKFCTYCIVPYTRGKERSRLPKDIIAEVKQLVAEGYKEVTLLGQNVNAYAKDLHIDYTLANLLEEVANTNIERVRFTTSHPWDFNDEMVAVIAKYDNIMPHIHLPVQSGNNEILKIMGRSYTRESYIELFDKLRATKDNMIITTDIIVGYPNETEEQFNDTLSLYEYCQFDYAFTFVYSPRAGTPAANMEDNIAMEVKKKRLYQLNEMVNDLAKKSNARMIDKELKVLILGESNKDPDVLAGYSEEEKLVLVKGSKDLIGEVVAVKVIETKQFNLVGELI